MAGNEITTSPPWKILSFILVVIFLCIAPIIIFMLYPNNMTISTRIFSFFIPLFLLSFIIPDQPIPSRRLKQCLPIFFWILLVEIFIFLLSQNFSLFAFHLSMSETHTLISLPSWPLWLGLWGYFSLILTMQHYAHYHLQCPSITSGLLFQFKNTYLDIAVRRALSFVSIGVNATAIYLLSISLIFISLEHLQPLLLEKFHVFSFLFIFLFFFLATLFNSKKIKKTLKQFALPNFFYLIIAKALCIAAIWISALLSQRFPFVDIFNNASLHLAEFSLKNIHPSPILFAGLFILVTPFFTSLIVKYAQNISRKKLLCLSFFPPSLFYCLLSMDPSFSNLPNILSHKIIFVVTTMLFFAVFLRGKTTGNFISGALPIPKQRVILPTGSYSIFPSHCLIIFNFYLLVIIIGPISLCAILTTAALLAAILGATSILSYFGKTYRLNRSFTSPPI